VAPRAARRDRVRVGGVADELGHLVAVLDQFGQDVRSDEPRCPGECDFHGPWPPALIDGASDCCGFFARYAPGLDYRQPTEFRELRVAYTPSLIRILIEDEC
jgi:hypothetical protein